MKKTGVREKKEKLWVLGKYFGQKMCAVSVSLTEKQFPFFLMPESVPHLSLSKAKEQTWAEMGGFVKNCVDAIDWCEISAGGKQSESLGAFMSECKHEIEVERDVVPIDKNIKGNHCMADICASEIHPALADVPSELWAKHSMMWD